MAYWYQKEPHRDIHIIPVVQRLPLVRTFAFPKGSMTPPVNIELKEEMRKMKQTWQEKYQTREEKGMY